MKQLTLEVIDKWVSTAKIREVRIADNNPLVVSKEVRVFAAWASSALFYYRNV